MNSAILAGKYSAPILTWSRRLLAILAFVNVLLAGPQGFAKTCESNVKKSVLPTLISENYSQYTTCNVPREVIQEYQGELVALHNAAFAGKYAKKLSTALLDKFEEFLKTAKIRFNRKIDDQTGFDAIFIDLGPKNIERMGWKIDRKVVDELVYCPQCLNAVHGNGSATPDWGRLGLDFLTLAMLRPSTTANHEMRHLELGVLRDNEEEDWLGLSFTELKSGSLRESSKHVYRNYISAEELFTFGHQFADMIPFLRYHHHQEFLESDKQAMRDVAEKAFGTFSQLEWLAGKFIPEIESEKEWTFESERTNVRGTTKTLYFAIMTKHGVELKIPLNSNERKLSKRANLESFNEIMLAKLKHLRDYGKILAADAKEIQEAIEIDGRITRDHPLSEAIAKITGHAQEILDRKGE